MSEPEASLFDVEEMEISFGPQHPATHGVLRLVITLDGETMQEVDPVVGYLHRGMEKIAENRTYLQFIPYTDRMDYLSPLSANVGFALAVEELLGVRVPPRSTNPASSSGCRDENRIS